MQPPLKELAPAPDPLVPAPRPSRRALLVRVVGTVFSLALLVFLISAQGWDEFAKVLRRIPVETFWIALAFVLCSRICVTLRWYVLLRSAQVKIPFWQCLRLVFMGLFASNFLPTTIGGDVVRMAGAVALRLDAGVITASLVLDRLIGMAGMSSLAPVGLAIVLGAGGGQPGAVEFPFAVLGGLSTGGSKRFGLAWVKAKARKFFASIAHSSMLWLKKPASLLLALLCTYGHMLFTYLTISLLLRDMHQSLSFWWVAGLWSLSYFITLVPVSVNGLGVQELSISFLYSHFGGISPEAGLALAIFMRFLPLLASLPGVLFLPEILRPLSSAPRKPDPIR